MLKKLVPFLVLLQMFSTFSTAAAPARLAILADDPAIASAGDVLTAELSSNEQLHLLERGEIEKILREQKLSAAGLTGDDVLKLARILGADGLLVLDVSKQGTNSFLNARLVAVKQGAVLDFLQTELPLKDAAQFSQGAARHLEPYFPKLTVLEKDAVPISILNLRLAASSKESAQLDRQLTALLINRLMREREIFVLERRRMDALSSEKELNADGSSFWSGSYLLEGTIDKNGFSKEQVTLSAKMSPPNGGVPAQIELAGKRTDLPNVVDDLAKKILQALQKSSSAPEWNPTEEAAQFFEEAKWALRWGMPTEAQSAADSAWALGRHDMETALVRVQSYRASCAYSGQVYKKFTYYKRGGETTEWTTLVQQPDPKKLEALLVALNLYYEFSQSIPPSELKWDSKWCYLGIDVLNAAGAVLQHFHFDPKSQTAVADKLADARTLARSVSKWLLQSPSVREIYWLNGKSVSHSTFSAWFERGTVQGALASYGRFWQEQPEDCIALYRELMRGEGYHRVRGDLLNRDQQNPPLCGWTPEDRQHAPKLWEDFLQELAASTNVVWRIEEKLQRMADADPNNPAELAKAFDAMLSAIRTNRDLLVRANAEVFENYDVLDLISGKFLEKTDRDRYSELADELRSIEQEFQENMRLRLEEQKNAEAFVKQKEYLKQKKPHDFGEFMQVFSPLFRTSPARAHELQPLLANYKADLVAQLDKKTGRERAHLQSVLTQIGILENRLEQASAPAYASSQTTHAASATKYAAKPLRLGSAPPVVQKTESPADVILAKRFFRIPAERLRAENLRVFAQRYSDSKVLLDLRYEQMDEIGQKHPGAGVVIWNPKNESADFVAYPPPTDGRGYVGSMFPEGRPNLHFELFNGALYFADWKGIQRCNLQTREWQTLTIPVQSLAQLFAADGHMFVTTDESILELLDNGQRTRLLASTRRRPVVSALDTLEKFGKPIIFPGPNHSIRTWIGKIYTWNGEDWSAGETVPANIPEIFDDGIIFRSHHPQEGDRLWLLPHEKEQSEFSLFERPQSPYGMRISTFAANHAAAGTDARWKNLQGFFLVNAGSATAHGNLYFFVEHLAVSPGTDGRWTFQEKDGRHADLVCLDVEEAKPIVVPLKFDLQQGEYTSQEVGFKNRGWIGGAASHWLMFAGNDLVIGRADMPGFWIIPRTEIQAAVAREKENRRRGDHEKAAAIIKRHKKFLAQYDANRDGRFSAAEKEKLFADPNGLEELWPAADSNKNGLLDSADQLALFDVNENGRCEPNELALLNKIQEIVGRELLARFDTNGDGVFSLTEFEEIPLSPVDSSTRRIPINRNYWTHFDADHNGKLDRFELEVSLRRRTQTSILSTLQNPLADNLLMMASQPGGLSEAQKLQAAAMQASAVESLWAHRSKVK